MNSKLNPETNSDSSSIKSIPEYDSVEVVEMEPPGDKMEKYDIGSDKSRSSFYFSVSLSIKW